MLQQGVTAEQAFSILSAIEECDLFDEVVWKVSEDKKTAAFYVDCSDVFAWGTADLEPITTASLPLLLQAREDCKGVKNGTSYISMLYCARRRNARPQGAVYPDSAPDLWPLLDAAGPAYPIGLGNPRRPGQVPGQFLLSKIAEECGLVEPVAATSIYNKHYFEGLNAGDRNEELPPRYKAPVDQLHPTEQAFKLGYIAGKGGWAAVATVEGKVS